MKVSDVKSMPVTRDDDDSISDLLRVEAFEQLPADLQESILAEEMRQLDGQLRYNYPLAVLCAQQRG
jgi:hypothetical protein